jgi:hypothetical protein
MHEIPLVVPLLANYAGVYGTRSVPFPAGGMKAARSRYLAVPCFGGSLTTPPTTDEQIVNDYLQTSKLFYVSYDDRPGKPGGYRAAVIRP